MNYLVVQLATAEAVIARFAVRRGALVFLEGFRRELSEEQGLSLMEGVSSPLSEEKIILLLRPDHVYSREINLPINDRRKLREVVPLELAGETVMDSDQLVFDAIPMQEGKTLALWAPRRELLEKIQVLAAQKLEPEFITVPSCHWQHILPPSERVGVVAITDGMSLSVFENGMLLFWRALGPADPVAEANRTLDLLYVGKGVEVSRVLFHGRDLAQQEQFQTGERTWMPLLPDDHIRVVFGNQESSRELLNAYTATIATHNGDAVNFRTGSLAYTAGRVKTRKLLRLSAALAACLALLVCLETGVRYYLVQTDLASLNKSISLMYREVFPARKKAVDEVGELRSEIRKLGDGGGGSVLAVINKVADLKGDDLTGIYEAEVEGDQVRLKGEAPSIQAVNNFKSRTAGIFSAADVGEIKTRPDGGVSFIFRGTYSEVKK